MRVVEGSLLPLLVNPLMQALLVFLAIPLVVGEGLLVETVPEPHYGEKFYQYGYQVEDLYTGEKNALYFLHKILMAFLYRQHCILFHWKVFFLKQ